MSERLRQAFAEPVVRFFNGEIQVSADYEQERRRLRWACQKAPAMLRAVDQGEIAEDEAAILTISRATESVTIGLYDHVQFTWSDAWHGEIFHGDGTIEFIGGGVPGELTSSIYLYPWGGAMVSQSNPPIPELAPARLVMDAFPRIERMVNGRDPWPDGLEETPLGDALWAEFKTQAYALLLAVGRGEGQFFRDLGDLIAAERPAKRKPGEAASRSKAKPPALNYDGKLIAAIEQLTAEFGEVPEWEAILARFNEGITTEHGELKGARRAIDKRRLLPRLAKLGFPWIAYPAGMP